ncbi:putative phage DNA transfer protein [Vibrio phage 501E54-1]|nr:putative phage DNA transfer protein [Vibrio phage 501E54-1]
MPISNESVQEIIDLKSQAEMDKQNTKFKGVIKNNSDIAEEVLGSRSAESSVRRIWKRYCEQGNYNGVVGSNPIAGGTYSEPEELQGDFRGKRFVFISAQNNTFRHAPFVESLFHYVDHIGAELVVGTFSYNKSGFQNGVKGEKEEWIDAKLKPYICNEQRRIAKGLVWCGELNILPTAATPLTGFKNYCGADSIIVPHAKHAAESVATPPSVDTKIMYTTGAATLDNYVQKTAGQKGKWWHTIGAVVVEVDDEGDWFVRQINCVNSSGEFQDLNLKVTPKGVVDTKANVAGIQWGDIHANTLSATIKKVNWGANSIAEVLKPEVQFAHDCLNFSDPNGHHTKDDPYYRFSSYVNNAPTIEQEVKQTYDVLEIMTNHGEVVVVESNHDLHLEQYLKQGCYKKDPRNALFFLRMQTLNYEAIARKEKLQTFKTACEMVNGGLSEKITFLKTDEPYNFYGIECGIHSHNGANGSRGSINGFANMGVRFNIGHSHSFGIRGSVFQSGVCMVQEDSGYAKGASSWSITHIITYNTGKRTGLTLKWSTKQKRWKWRG